MPKQLSKKYNANILVRKLFLTQIKLIVLESEMKKVRPSKLMTYTFWTLGFLGLHRYYLKQTKYATFMLVTLGGLGLWWLADLLFIEKAFARRCEHLEHKVLDSIHTIDYA